MASRVVRPSFLDLRLEPVPDPQWVSGQPRTGSAALDDVHGLDVGVWEHTPGASTDVEADEVFVVLTGRATIEIADGPVLEVGPGDIGVLEAGARTTWTVHEHLRKVYVSPGVLRR